MTQNEVIKAIAEKCGVTPPVVKEVLAAQAELAGAQLKNDDEFVLFGFGKLKAKTTKERQGRNPATGESVTITSSRQVRLALGKNFKEVLQSK